MQFKRNKYLIDVDFGQIFDRTIEVLQVYQYGTCEKTVKEYGKQIQKTLNRCLVKTELGLHTIDWGQLTLEIESGIYVSKDATDREMLRYVEKCSQCKAYFLKELDGSYYISGGVCVRCEEGAKKK